MAEVIAEWWVKLSANIGPIVILGLLGQAVFMTRFLVQWIASERAGKSIMPTAFWWLPICGSAMVFVYAIIIAEPVFIIGQSLGFIIYTRNLVLIRRDKKDQAHD